MMKIDIMINLIEFKQRNKKDKSLTLEDESTVDPEAAESALSLDFSILTFIFQKVPKQLKKERKNEKRKKGKTTWKQWCPADVAKARLSSILPI